MVETDLSQEQKVLELKEMIIELDSAVNTESIHSPKKLIKLAKKIDKQYFSIKNPNERKIARTESLKLLSLNDVGTLQDASLAIDSSGFAPLISIVALGVSIFSIVRSIYTADFFLFVLLGLILYFLVILLKSFGKVKNTKLLNQFIKEAIIQKQQEM